MKVKNGANAAVFIEAAISVVVVVVVVTSCRSVPVACCSC